MYETFWKNILTSPLCGKFWDPSCRVEPTIYLHNTTTFLKNTSNKKKSHTEGYVFGKWVKTHTDSNQNSGLNP